MNQSNPRSKSVLVGLAAGVGLTALAAVMMGQGASQPVKSEPQYFVTADGDGAHLWVREGTAPPRRRPRRVQGVQGQGPRRPRPQGRRRARPCWPIVRAFGPVVPPVGTGVRAKRPDS
jgi:hypothetical protein